MGVAVPPPKLPVPWPATMYPRQLLPQELWVSPLKAPKEHVCHQVYGGYWGVAVVVEALVLLKEQSLQPSQLLWPEPVVTASVAVVLELATLPTHDPFHPKKHWPHLQAVPNQEAWQSCTAPVLLSPRPVYSSSLLFTQLLRRMRPSRPHRIGRPRLEIPQSSLGLGTRRVLSFQI